MSTATVAFVLIEKCVTHAQFPAGILVILGTPLSVANVAIRVLVLALSVLTTVVCPVTVPVGDHCLYVGVPKAVFVFSD
jgi:hypothetical protein